MTFANGSRWEYNNSTETMLVQMTIDSIRMSMMNYQRVVILKENQGKRYLPIWIGPAEADSIAVKLQEVSVPRPLTHDLLRAVVDVVGGRVQAAIMNRLHNDTYYAQLVLMIGQETLALDCRPSDAIGLAVRTDAPIYARQSLLERAGIYLEKEGHDSVEAAQLRLIPEPEGGTGTPCTEPQDLWQTTPQFEPPPDLEGPMTRFSDDASYAFRSAKKRAMAEGSGCVRTDQLLLALLEEEDGLPVTHTILRRLGLTSDTIVTLRDSLPTLEESVGTEGDELTCSLKDVIRLALSEATRLKDHTVDARHLLLALLSEGSGTAAKILQRASVTVDKVYVQWFLEWKTGR